MGRFLYLGRVIFGAKWRAVDVSFTKASWILYRYPYPYLRGLGTVFDFLLPTTCGVGGDCELSEESSSSSFEKEVLVSRPVTVARLVA